eukprot:gene3010-3284_t
MATAAASGALLTWWSLTDYPTVAFCAGNKLTIKELISTLEEMIKAPREKLRSQQRATPILNIRSLRFENDPINLGNETHVIEVQFKPKECNPLLLVKPWLSTFGDTDDVITSHLEKLQTFYRDPTLTSLPLVAKSKTTSMTISKFTNREGSKVGITLFKDGGFDKSDLSAIIDGYREGFSNPPGSSKKSPPIQFKLDPSFEPPLEEADSFMKGLGPFIRERRIFNNERMMEDNEEGNIQSSNSSDPIQELKKMGVEVFDRSNNAEMTWEQLAGYDQVKQRIQETVVLALQYPDIYDQVAKHTRSFFESNRPKAVLLEGPPGTGKTLTARILASQCDTPLVVLSLEGIVSKYYGDSEKKLGKILEACDRIEGGAILFVDEIDALATSRDSDTGMHEVTRRILSVLLTRLEGFKGKAKSIMICTTNRKTDLDPALLSRFDLTISYSLPDFVTRQEIFKRYAKQFLTKSQQPRQGGPGQEQQEDIYSTLAEASEGLSCRDIKEACQQAERLCASRYIQNHVLQQQKNAGSSSTASDGSKQWFRSFTTPSSPEKETPTLSPSIEDYLNSLRQRQAQQQSVGMLRRSDDPHTVI